MKTNEYYVAYYKALVEAFKKEPVEWLAIQLTGMIVEEDIKKDLKEESEPKAKAAEDEANRLLEMLAKAHDAMTAHALNLQEAMKTAKTDARREVGRNAANGRHNQPGGSREKRSQICLIWASGKYSSRDICAEQECAGLGMSFSAARKALRNTPDPQI
jgi:hypothetical protein